MVGEAWNSAMQAGLDTSGFSMLIYFVSYVLLQCLLYANLIVGVICNGYDAVTTLREESGTGKLSVRQMKSALTEV